MKYLALNLKCEVSKSAKAAGSKVTAMGHADEKPKTMKMYKKPCLEMAAETIEKREKDCTGQVC